MSSADNRHDQGENGYIKQFPPPLYLIKATAIIILTGTVLFVIYTVKNILLLVIISAVIAIGLEPIWQNEYHCFLNHPKDRLQ